MNDLQLFAKCFVECSDVKLEEKETLFDFIDVAEDYEIMNLLMTGSPDFLSEDEKAKIYDKFQNTVAFPLVVMEHLPALLENSDFASMLTTEAFDVEVPDFITNFFANLSKKVSGIKSYDFDKLKLYLDKLDVKSFVSYAEKMMKSTTGLAAATVAAIFLFLAVKYLKNRLSAANKACKKFKGQEKKQCIAKYKIDIIKGQIAILKKGLAQCKKTKDPAKCQKKIMKKINKLQAKQASLQASLNKKK